MNNEIAKYAQTRESFVRKFFSLWAIIYVIVFIVTSQFSPFKRGVNMLVLWLGNTFLHLGTLKKIPFTGSGDTIIDYGVVVLGIAVSVVLSVMIAIIDRKRKNYQYLYLFTIVLARYYVAYTLLVYGFGKVFNGQFGPVSYYALEEKFGNMSPMGVLWNFMDASRAYTFFGGLVEVIGGLLLLFRKTKTFGALFSMTVMINVMVLNFTYDVPVKIFSTHIVLLCIFILSFEWVKLFNFFVLHKTVALNYNRLFVRKKWLRIALISLKVLLIAYLVNTFFISRLLRQGKGKIPLAGAYCRDIYPEKRYPSQRSC